MRFYFPTLNFGLALMTSFSLRKNLAVEVGVFSITLLTANVCLSVWRIFYPTSRILEQSVLAACVAGLVVFWVFKTYSERARKSGLISSLSPQFGWAVSAAVFVSVLFSWMVINSIDRSNSFFLIQWLGESRYPLDLSQIKIRILNVYSTYDFTAVESRLVEHEKRGIVIREGNEYRLSTLGQLIYRVTSILSQLFSLSGWKSV